MMGMLILLTVGQGWWRTYDGGGDDWSYSVCVDDSDNVIVVGNSYTDSNTGVDGHIWKYDPNGTLLWHVAIASSGSEWMRGVDTDPNGNIYVAMTDYSANEMRVLKYDRTGNFIWNHSYGDDYVDEASAIVYAPQGYVYAAGYAADNGGHADALVIKYDTASSTPIWVVHWDGGGLFSHDEAYAIAITPGGNPVIGGCRSNLGADLQAYLVEFRASDGAELRVANYDWNSSQDDIIEDIDISASGDIVAVGRTQTSPSSAQVVRYNSTFSEIWQRTISSPSGRRSLYGVAIGPGDTILVAGLWVNASGDRDFWLRKYTWSGSLAWDTLIDHTPGTDDWAEECTWDGQGYVIASGGTTPSNQDMLVYKLPINQVDNPEPTGEKSFTAFPNPFNRTTRISGGKGPFAVYDATGRLVLSTDKTDIGRALEPGVYFLQDASGRRIRLIKR